MAPHELGIGSAGALFVECEKFLIFGEGNLEGSLEEMLFGNFDLIAFDFAHLLEGLDVDLLKSGELAV
jgi:hypothetical protein